MVKRTPVRTPQIAPQGPVSPEQVLGDTMGALAPSEVADAVVSIKRSGGLDAYTDQLLGHSCAFFASEMLMGPPDPPYDGRFLIGHHHEEWDELVRKFERVCIMAPRDHGKCQVGDALILTPSGERVRIDEWAGGDVYAYDTETHALVKTHAPASRPNGVKPVLRVRTRSGRTVTVTKNHPLRLLDRWCRADELQVGQRIAVPYTSPTEATGRVFDAWLLGLLVGDGGLTGSNVVLSTDDDAVLNAVEAQGVEVVHADRCSYRLLGMQKRMRMVGLMGKGAHDKRVPKCIFTADNDSVAEFVAGYLDADAGVNEYGGASVEFYSVSEQLLRDVQHLLTRLGVLAALAPKRDKYKGAEHWSWRLTVRGKDLVTLADKVHPRGKRFGQFADVLAQQLVKSQCSGPALDRYPKQVWKLVEHSEDWFRRNGLLRPNTAYEPTREKLRGLSEAEGNAELLALADAPVFWDEIAEIEAIGERETWSIHVPGHENYLADDVVNHNTFFFDFAYPIWRAYYEDNGIGFIFSATATQAERILQDIKEELERNPKLQHLVPKTKTMWSSTAIRLSNGHRIFARGFGTKVRGAHPTWIVVDDGLNDEDAYSETVRKKHVDYFYTAITNMIVPGGQIIVVGTPFHENDLYAQLRTNPEYKFKRYQALDEATGRVLWPERYSKERLERRQREIGAIRFAREFQCVPVSDEMSLFPSTLFQGSPVEQPLVKLGMPIEFWRKAGIRSVFVGVDIALSSSAGADFTVIWVMGLDMFQNRWILDIFRDKGLAYHVQLSHINSFARRYQADLVFIESNQAQRVFGTELIRTTDLPIKLYETGEEKHSLEKGVPSLRVKLENQKYRIPRGDTRSVELTDVWKAEMRSFTFDEGKVVSVGAHDDTVMGCWMCENAISQGAFSFSFGDEEDDIDDEAIAKGKLREKPLTKTDLDKYMEEVGAEQRLAMEAVAKGTTKSDERTPDATAPKLSVIDTSDREFKEGAPPAWQIRGGGW